jgi:hypothetical protein
MKEPNPFACCDWLCVSVVGAAFVPPRVKPDAIELADTDRF